MNRISTLLSDLLSDRVRGRISLGQAWRAGLLQGGIVALMLQVGAGSSFTLAMALVMTASACAALCCLGMAREPYLVTCRASNRNTKIRGWVIAFGVGVAAALLAANGAVELLHMVGVLGH